MATENEPAKLLLPYLQRADELQKHEPLVSYYCRLYAMERGLKIPQKERTKTTNALLVSLMNQLEKDKKSLTLGPDDHLHVEGFALNVFSKADKQDRAGRADLNTAKTFYAASIFFEILNQFGPVQPDLEQKQKYAAWKAADIRKAVKEGRKPVPGPPGGEEDDLSLLSRGSSGEYDHETTGGESAARPDSSRVNPSSTMQQDSEFSPHQYHNVHSSSSFSSQPSNVIPPPSNLPPPHHSNNDSPPDNYHQQPSNLPPSHHYNNDSPPDNYHQQPSNLSTPPDNYYQLPPNIPEHHSVYSQSYNHQPYQSEHQQHNPSQNIPPYSYPNFQSYPSFTESSLPTVPSHYPSYYQGQGVDGSYTNLPPANTATFPSSKAQNDSSGSRNGSVPEASQITAQKYEYDSNYEPPPAQIAEAQKAARFAVGALAFDDVFVAVDHLKKALELLTKPSAGH